METFLINFSINVSEYPKISSYNSDEITGICKYLFNTWYVNNFENNINMDNLHSKITSNMTTSINLMMKNINDNVDKLTNTSNEMNQLNKEMYGITKSNKKGQMFENIIETIIHNNFQNYSYQNTAQIPHSGDGLIVSVSGLKCIIEMKNYSVTVPSGQIKKLKNDMKITGLKYAIMISANSAIQGKKNMDIEIFINEGIEYCIVYTSFVFEQDYKIQTAISLIEHIFNINTKSKNIILDNISSELYNLNELIDSMSKIKNNFLSMEKTIKDNLDGFYLNFRETETNMKLQIDTIMNTINMKSELFCIESEKVFEHFSTIKECTILKKLYDEIFSIEKFEMNIENNLINLIDTQNNNCIAEIKFIAKRIDVQFINPEIKISINNSNISINEKIIKTIILDYKNNIHLLK